MAKQKVTSVPWQIRQGDVAVERVGKAPQGLRELPKEHGGVVLAYGEVTGHMHIFRDPGVCMLRNDASGERILMLESEALLQHDEHTAIAVPAGTYRVVQQCEWDYLEEMGRQVAD